MPETSSNNRRIAKNTLMLYIRMGFVMLAQLYAARIVLDVLGASNYGIYNVVGGIVIMFSFLSRTLASASQRYFAFELGRKDYTRLNNVFNINLLLFCIILGIIILLAETVGVWFLHTQLTIPEERMLAASWVFQFSVFSFSATILAIPYQATIIAREKMDVYAYIGILEATLNLCFVLLLQHLHWNVDLLIVYGALMFLLHLITNGSYVIIARRRYSETRYQFYWDTKLAKEVISYSSWNLFGTVAGIVRSQGINILINMFFNPAINAARGLAYQINTALNQFSHNFFTAVRPQVTKYYAQGDREAALTLVFSSARLTFYLMQFLAVPVIVYAHEVLDFWLVDIPFHTELFMVLVICMALIDSISNPLMTLAQATGRVKLYQSVVGGLLILNLPISWTFLKAGYGAEFTMYVAIAIAALSLFVRLFILRKLVTFPVLCFCRNVLGRILVTFLCALVLTSLVKMYIYEPFASQWMLCLSIAISIVINVCVIATVGLSRAERITTHNILRQKIKKSQKG